MQLRPYQSEAVLAAEAWLATGGHPALQLATGTGKSLIIAELARRAASGGLRVWVLTHIQQLVAQNSATYLRHTGVIPAVICSGLNRRDLGGEVTYGTIQSVTGALPSLAPPDLIIVDEAHRIPHRAGEPGMYAALLGRYPAAQRVAMTATPWRADDGRIYGTEPGCWFDGLAYEYSVADAVKQGYLCPLVGVSSETQLDLSGVELQNGDYAQSEVAGRQTDDWLRSVARSLPGLAGARRHVAVYCPSVVAARRTADAIASATGWTAEVLHGGASQALREDVLGRFASGELRVLCSVDMLTTGFDLPALDCIVCLRPTQSSSLWVQMQGRGTRLHPSKTNCLVLDYVGNLFRLGGVGMCERYYRQRDGVAEPASGEPEPPAPRKPRQVLPGLRTLTPLDPMTGQPAGDGAELRAQVHSVNCVALATRRSRGVQVLMVQYACTTAEGARIDATRFLHTERPDSACVEFFSARRLAVNLPARASRLTWLVRDARRPQALTVRRSGRYWDVVQEHFGDENE